MLVDTLINAPFIENVHPGAQEWLRGELQRAQKFELAPDFAAAAEELCENFGTIAAAIPHCRLPYGLVWLEVAQQHRPRFLAAGVHVPEIQGVPTRVGFLFYSEDPKLAHFTVHQFWHLKGFVEPHMSNMMVDIDPARLADVNPDQKVPEAKHSAFPHIPTSPQWLKASNLTKAQLDAVVMTGTSRFADPILQHPAIVQEMMEIGAVDWAGETVYLLAVLALMNTLNATEAQPISRAILNLARAKKRQPPLADHSVLTIHPRLKRHVEGDAAAHGHRALRSHLVRGHWKIRKSGVYFWRPHSRGKKGPPVSKTYRVE